MTLLESLRALSEQNHAGVAFLWAYGFTWLICGLIWVKASARWAALATLFQGMVAFPLALGLSVMIGALGQDRPVEPLITQLSIYIGTSQLLGLPFLVYLFRQQQYHLMPYAFVAICAMHFMLYSWLYQTVWYVVMAVVLAVGGLIIQLRWSERQGAASSAARICLFTGVVMLATSGLLVL